MNIAQLAAPFPPDVVSWRVGPTTKNKDKGMALAYIDARDVQDRLTEVCGPFGWQCRHEVSGDKRVTCHIGIKEPETGEWIWRSDGAGESEMDGEKGSYSDSFKRAAVKWGVGRYLYDIDSPWVAITPQGKSYVIPPDSLKRLAALLAKGMPVQQPKQEADKQEMVTALSAVVRSFLDDLHICETDDELSNWATRVKTALGKKIISDDEREALMPAYLERKHYLAEKRQEAA